MSENLIVWVNNIEIFNGKFNFLFKCDLKGDLFEDIDLYDFKEISCYARDKCV